MREAASFIVGQTSLAPAGAVSSALRYLHGALRYWTSRRSLARLSELDDHMLADIGFTREEVRWALDLPFGYDPAGELLRHAASRPRRGWRG